jgi:hypothetical protein
MRRLFLLLMAAACGKGGRLPPEPLPTPAADIPAWFAAPGATPHRIAGHLLIDQAPAAGRVYLRLDAPDPSVWAGAELDVDASGSFDFGPRPPGRYLLVATTPTMTSRPIPVDTRDAAVENQDVFLHECTRHEGVLRDGSRPVADARFDLGGVALATTARDGSYSLCVADDPDRANAIRVRSPSHAVVDAGVSYDGWTTDTLEEQTELRGVIINLDGRPLAGVGVQPVLVRQREMTHAPMAIEMPLVATTDANGRFRIRGAPRWEEEGLEALYRFRLFQSGKVYDDEKGERTRGRSDVRIMLPTELLRDTEDGWISPRDTSVSGHVTHEGQPLSDALITVEYNYGGGGPSNFERTRSDRDGAFTIDIPSQFGTVILSVSHSGGLTTARRLHSDKPIDNLIIDVRQASSIAGEVVDAHGAPVSDKSLWVQAQDAPIHAYTGTRASGRFRIDGLESGRLYDLEVAGEHREIAVGVAPTIGLRIVVEPWVIAGIVLDENGAPAAGVGVFASGQYDGPYWRPPGTDGGVPIGQTILEMGYVATTDAVGRFRWEPGLDSDSAIAATSPDGRSGVVERIRPGTTTAVIRLQHPGALTVDCGQFRPGIGPIEVWRGLVEAHFDCGQTLTAMTPGVWHIAAAGQGPEVASTTANVVSGEQARAHLSTRPLVKLVGRAVEYPSGKPIAGAECVGGVPFGEHAAGRGDARSGKDGVFTFEIPTGKLEVWCDERTRRHARGETHLVLDADGETEVRMVATKLDAVSVGVDFEMEARGARVVAVRSHAERAGLQVGDLVVASNSVALAGLGDLSAEELAFHVPKGEKATWNVERDGQMLAIEVTP